MLCAAMTAEVEAVYGQMLTDPGIGIVLIASLKLVGCPVDYCQLRIETSYVNLVQVMTSYLNCQ
jgi:hypothetical protein